MSWMLGADAPTPGRGLRRPLAVRLACDYESQEHLQAYYSTPEHAAVVDEIVPLIADRDVSDFEL